MKTDKTKAELVIENLMLKKENTFLRRVLKRRKQASVFFRLKYACLIFIKEFFSL